MFAFQTNALNRHGDIRHKDDFIQSVIGDNQSQFLPVFQQSILSYQSESGLKPYWLHYSELAELFGEVKEKHLIYLGEIDSKHYFTYRLKSEQSSQKIMHWSQHDSVELCGLRNLFKLLGAEHAHLCSVAIAMEHWHNTHQFCGYCGHLTFANQAGFVRSCSNKDCGKDHFPRTDSAVICAITYEDGAHGDKAHSEKILLGRQENWPENRYSVIAGFVEPGETLEQAVARETYEETGIKVTNIQYYRSQPWPFPQSLMVGFTAEAITTDIKLLDKELERAKWFSRSDIHQAVEQGNLILPFKYSISRELINQWLSQKN